MTEFADEHAAALTELPPVYTFPVYTFTDETCRSAAKRMATTGHIRLAVLDRDTMQPRGYVSLQDLLIGRRRFVEREEDRERVFRLMRSQTPEPPAPPSPEKSPESIRSNMSNANRSVILSKAKDLQFVRSPTNPSVSDNGSESYSPRHRRNRLGRPVPSTQPPSLTSAAALVSRRSRCRSSVCTEKRRRSRARSRGQGSSSSAPAGA
jgi:hypothetical protein